ncbi:MAG: hypothetical protein BWY67_01906 [Bacteroidetes bacterium ADurb.Bin397]|nr:MAG: hypothetical protein BWY67_01906 [Bacteroidetes bacterium ADurb.Bin397]
MMSPIEPTITPMTEMIEIIFITLCDFLAKRYLLAIKISGRMILYFQALTINPVPVACFILVSKKFNINETG